jgi:toxin FitB
VVGYLLDTVAVSELRRRAGHPGFINWARQADSRDFWICTPTIAEIRRGIQQSAMRGRMEQAADLEAWFRQAMLSYFEERVLAFDFDAAETWAELTADWPRGAPIPYMDSQIAAIGHARGLTVITRNSRDFVEFEKRGLMLFNPWQA